MCVCVCVWQRGSDGRLRTGNLVAYLSTCPPLDCPVGLMGWHMIVDGSSELERRIDTPTATGGIGTTELTLRRTDTHTLCRLSQALFQCQPTANLPRLCRKPVALSRANRTGAVLGATPCNLAVLPPWHFSLLGSLLVLLPTSGDTRWYVTRVHALRLSKPNWQGRHVHQAKPSAEGRRNLARIERSVLFLEGR